MILIPDQHLSSGDVNARGTESPMIAHSPQILKL